MLVAVDEFPVQAVACACYGAADIEYSLPSCSWIRPARRWRCTAMPTWFGRSLGQSHVKLLPGLAGSQGQDALAQARCAGFASRRLARGGSCRPTLGGAGGSGEPEPGNYPLIPSDRARGVLRDEVVAERKIVYLWNVGQGSSRLEGEACSTLAMSSQRRAGTAPEPSH